MSNVLIIADLQEGQIKKVTRELCTTARAITSETGGKVVALVFDGGQNDALKEAGADVIVTSSLEYSPEGVAEVAAKVAGDKGCNIVLAGHTYAGKDFAPRIAAKLNAGIVSDVVEIKLDGGKLKTKKPIYSGKAFADIVVQTDNAVATLRPNSVEVQNNAGEGAAESVDSDGGSVQTKFAATEQADGPKIQLTEADIIVSGGRGMKGPENYAMLQELCDVIGAALGASRAAVDSGWIDHSHQVGQTGKTVSPNLYIACGISGAIQHLAGMGSSKYIVAINKDPDAPIFKVATYGVVADLFEVVPALTTEFKKALS